MMMSDFIDEFLIVNIVSRLPVESVQQCRCVCKRWRDVLHEHHFSQVHTERALQQQQQQQTVSLFMNANFPKMEFSEFQVEDYHINYSNYSNKVKICLNSDSFPQVKPQLNNQEQIVSFFMFVNIPNTNNYEFHLQDYYVNYADEYEYADDEDDDDVVSSSSSHKVSRPLHPPPMIIFDDDDDDEWKWKVKLRVKGKEDSFLEWFIIGSINGLIGLYGYHKSDYCNYPIIIIYNPVTREYLDVPTDDERSFCVKDDRHMATGFGYNPKTNEYKIVRIIHQKNAGDGDNEYVRWIQIYTLGSGWRIIKEGRVQYYFGSSGVAFNGGIYWIAVNTIVCFDLEDEKLRVIPSPPISVSRMIGYELRVLGECLCLIEENTNIWIMNNKNNNTSTREYSKFYLPIADWTKGSQYQPIAVATRGRVLYLYSRRFLYAFDPWTNTRKSLGEIPMFKGSYRIASYTKSLVSLKALGEENAKIIGQQHATEDAKIVIEQQFATEKKMTYPTKRKRSGSIDMKTQLIGLFTSLLLNWLVG